MTSTLNELNAMVSKWHFVFNINEELLKENSFYNQSQKGLHNLDVLLSQDS